MKVLDDPGFAEAPSATNSTELSADAVVRPGATMQASYSIDLRHGILRLKVVGELTAPGLMALMNQAALDPAFRPGMPAIADYRDAHGNWDYSEIQHFRDYVVRIALHQNVRWAAVVKPGSLVAIGYVLILISDAVDCRIKMEMFEDPAVALRWVRGEID